MWRYIHARTVVRVLARIQGPVSDHSAELHRFLRRAIEGRDAFAILQVGAYDGVSNDSVHDLLRSYEHVRAVLLEPQPGPYALLQSLWQGSSRVVTLQCALAETAGERPLYVIADEYKDRHPFPDQISSFYRWRVELACSRYAWRPSPDFITSVQVPTVDWRTLVQTYGPFDFVAIDAEGYDADILHQIDLVETPPEIILYEHVLLGRSTRRLCERLLRSRGYAVTRVNQLDTLATRCGRPGF